MMLSVIVSDFVSQEGVEPSVQDHESCVLPPTLPRNLKRIQSGLQCTDGRIRTGLSN